MDKKGSITVIAKEKHMTYARPLISYYLEGKTTLNKMKYRTNSFYKKNNVEVLLDSEVTKIDKKAAIKTGDRLTFGAVTLIFENLQD